MVIKPGTYFYASWGYDQTNIDFMVVEKVSPTGKTAVCRMARPIHLGAVGQTDAMTPGEAFGVAFRMKITNTGRLRGSYPFVQTPQNGPSYRLCWASPCKVGDTHLQTNSMFGH